MCSSSHPFNSIQVHKQRQMTDANNTCPPSPLLHTLEQIPHTVFSPGNVLYSLIPLLMGSTNSYCISYLPKEGYFYLKCWVHLCLSNATFFSNTSKRLGFFLSFSNSHGKWSESTEAVCFLYLDILFKEKELNSSRFFEIATPNPFFLLFRDYFCLSFTHNKWSTFEKNSI